MALQQAISRLDDARARGSDGCDATVVPGDFGSRINVPYTPKIEHHCPIFPKGNLSIGIVGASGCGKTFQLLSIVPNIANLSQVIICTLVANEVYHHLAQWCANERVRIGNEVLKDKEHPDGFPIDFGLFNDAESAEDGISKMIGRKKPGTWGIIVFDDFNQGTTSTTNRFVRVQNMCFMQLRNYGYHSAVITQSYTNVSTKSRCNMNMRFVFAMHDRWAVESFTQEFANETGWNTDDFKQFYHETTRVRHAYILLVTEDSETKIYRRVDDKKGPELVCLREALDVGQDHKIAELIARYKKAESDGSRAVMMRCRRELTLYVKYLAKSSGTDEDDIAAQIYDVFNFDL